MKWFWSLFLLAAASSVLGHFFLLDDKLHGWERIPGAWGIFGLASAFALSFGTRLLRLLLNRREEYYDELESR